MDDQEIITQIGSLADEEKALEERHVGEGISAEEEARLRTIEVTLDQPLGPAPPTAGPP